LALCWLPDGQTHIRLDGYARYHLRSEVRRFTFLGFPDQASAQSSAAIAEARRLAHLPSLAVSLAIGARLLSIAGDDAALDERADEPIAVATEHDFPLWGAQGMIYRGWVR
jgi:hypothetical protein